MMASNVQCAGGGWWRRFGLTSFPTSAVVRAAPDAPDGSSEPCGWEDYRAPHPLAAWLRGADRAYRANPADITAKPCPRCGGTVARIQPEKAADG